MIDLFVSILSGLAEIGRQVGFLGLVLAGLVLGALYILVRFADRALGLVGKLSDGWRRLSLGVRQIIVAVVGGYIVLRYGAAIGRRLLGLGLPVLGWYAAYWIGAQHLRRGDTDSSNWEIWRRWARTLARTRAHDAAAKSAMGKENGPKVVVAPVIVDEIERVVYLPQDGTSAAALATELREGKFDSAATRRANGPRRVIAANVLPDGTVLAEFDTRPAPEPVDLSSRVLNAPPIVGQWTP